MDSDSVLNFRSPEAAAETQTRTGMGLSYFVSLKQDEIGRNSSSPATRIQKSILATREHHILNWLCRHLPRSVTPNQLTAIGVLGSAIVFLGYLASHIHPAFLWLATLGYVINWLGDSLDGSLARYRRIESPRYGYFLDHSADAISILLVMLGLGLSGYVRLDAALFALLGYFMMCIYVFLSNHVTGRFQLSFLGVGPTEMRIGLMMLTGLMYFGYNSQFAIASQQFSILDIILAVNGLMLIGLFVVNTLKVLRELRGEDSTLPLPRHETRARNIKLH